MRVRSDRGFQENRDWGVDPSPYALYRPSVDPTTRYFGAGERTQRTWGDYQVEIGGRPPDEWRRRRGGFGNGAGSGDTETEVVVDAGEPRDCRVGAGFVRPRSRCKRPASWSSFAIFWTASSASEGRRAPVQTSVPLPKRSTTTRGSSRRQTSPGNCSGSYSTRSRPRVTATEFRLISLSRLEVETMFCTSIFGCILIRCPSFLICRAMVAIEVSTWRMLLAPVQTSLPEWNSRIAVFGSLSR